MANMYAFIHSPQTKTLFVSLAQVVNSAAFHTRWSVVKVRGLKGHSQMWNFPKSTRSCGQKINFWNLCFWYAARHYVCYSIQVPVGSGEELCSSIGGKSWHKNVAKDRYLVTSRLDRWQWILIQYVFEVLTSMGCDGQRNVLNMAKLISTACQQSDRIVYRYISSVPA